MQGDFGLAKRQLLNKAGHVSVAVESDASAVIDQHA
jgi:hypothetical protein